MMRGEYSLRLRSALLSHNEKVKQAVTFKRLEVVAHQLQRHEKKGVKKRYKNPLFIQGQSRICYQCNITRIDCIIQRLYLIPYRFLFHLKVRLIR